MWRISILIIAEIAVVFALNCSAQGLKGTEANPKEILGRQTYILGDTDSDRWKTLQSAAPQLLGMNHGQVKRALGEPMLSMDGYTYGITREPVTAAPKKWATLRIEFSDGRVVRYSVESK